MIWFVHGLKTIDAGGGGEKKKGARLKDVGGGRSKLGYSEELEQTIEKSDKQEKTARYMSRKTEPKKKKTPPSSEGVAGQWPERRPRECPKREKKNQRHRISGKKETSHGTQPERRPVEGEGEGEVNRGGELRGTVRVSWEEAGVKSERREDQNLNLGDFNFSDEIEEV